MQGFTNDLHRNVFCSSCFMDEAWCVWFTSFCSSNIMVKDLFVDFDRRLHWSEPMHLGFGVSKALFVENVHKLSCISSDRWGLRSVCSKKKYKTCAKWKENKLIKTLNPRLGNNKVFFFFVCFLVGQSWLWKWLSYIYILYIYQNPYRIFNDKKYFVIFKRTNLLKTQSENVMQQR